MKRFTLITAVLIILSASLPLTLAQAQTGGDLIVLNDSTPGIDVVINPSPNTTGVIALEIENVSVTMTDAVGNVVFETNDPDLAGIEFSFAPNAGQHTLIVERLPGASQGYARITPLAEMSAPVNRLELVDTAALALAQEADYPLNAASPSSVVGFAVDNTTPATITARFPGAPVTAQLVNTPDNRVVATLTGSLIDGIRFQVTEGMYELVLLNNNPAQNTVANVSFVPAEESDFDAMVAQAEAANTTTLTTTAAGSSAAVAAPTCTLAISASSVNLRSGPGTGYSVLDYAFRGDVLPVGGISTQSNWLLVGHNDSSGWIAGDLGTLAGSCADLTAYDIPYSEAAAPVVTIQQPQVPVFQDDDYGDDYDDDHSDDHDESDDHDDDHDDD